MSLNTLSLKKQVEPHAALLRSCAANLEAAGFGTDSHRGHAKLLRHMADHLETEAEAGRIPRAFGDDDGHLAAAAGGGNPGAAALSGTGTAENGMDLQALARIEARRLVDPTLARLMRDLKLEAGAGVHNGMYDVHDIDERLKSAIERLPHIYGKVSTGEVKIRLTQAGLMTAGRYVP